jgi:hypothetical protein
VPTTELLRSRRNQRKSLAGNFETNRATVASFGGPAFGPLVCGRLPESGRCDDGGAGHAMVNLLRAGAPARRGGGRTVTVDDGRAGRSRSTS